jgi:hypothetical protein
VRAPDALGQSSWALLSPKGGADLTSTPGNVLHVVVHKAAPQYYQIQLTHDIAAAVPAKSSLHWRFWAHSATKTPIHVVIEKRAAPYTHYLDKVVALTPVWRQYDFIAVPSAYGPGGLAARLQLGQQSGVVELKGIAVSAGRTDATGG